MLKTFLKKYGYYLLAFSLILVVGISAGLASAMPMPPQDEPIDSSQQTQTVPQTMLCPLEGCEVLKWYSDSELFYNTTLKQWESHRGVDLTSKITNEVRSVLDGVVTDVCYSYEDGYCVTVQHENGLETVYCSLKNDETVKKGDSVKRGQKLGNVSTTATNESLAGDHLHFQVLLNGKPVDPANYLTFENK